MTTPKERAHKRRDKREDKREDKEQVGDTGLGVKRKTRDETREEGDDRR